MKERYFGFRIVKTAKRKHTDAESRETSVEEN